MFRLYVVFVKMYKFCQLICDDVVYFLCCLMFVVILKWFVVVQGFFIVEVFFWLVEELCLVKLLVFFGYEFDVWMNFVFQFLNCSEIEQIVLQVVCDEQYWNGIEQVCQWWIDEVVCGMVLLCENLIFWFELIFGSLIQFVDVFYVFYGCNVMICSYFFGSVLVLFEEFVFDLVMMIQIGMDEYIRIWMFDCGVKFIFDYWIVGIGFYENVDVENLLKVLIGWCFEFLMFFVLSLDVDVLVFCFDWCIGLMLVFDVKQFDVWFKMLLGMMVEFDVCFVLSYFVWYFVMVWRFGILLLEYCGVENLSVVLFE